MKSGRNPESDIRWSDCKNCITADGEFIVNGEGSFTPVTNSASGADGTYVSGSGFWWSVPTTQLSTGTGYIPGSTATLETGATFVTEIEIVVPDDPNNWYTAQFIRVDGDEWDEPLTGDRKTQRSTTATYLQNQGVEGEWSLTAPTITERPDGDLSITGTLTYTTTESYTVKQEKSKLYGQLEFMPGSIQVDADYGLTSVTLTSHVQSATITYTGQSADSPSSTTLSNQLLTTSTLTNRKC